MLRRLRHNGEWVVVVAPLHNGPRAGCDDARWTLNLKKPFRGRRMRKVIFLSGWTIYRGQTTREYISDQANMLCVQRLILQFWQLTCDSALD